MIGMAVDSGNIQIKQQLADKLTEAALLAASLNLWFDGKEAANVLNQLGEPVTAPSMG